MSAQVYSVHGQTEGKGRPFWRGQTHLHPLNYLLHVRVMLTIIKELIILLLPCLWKQRKPWKFSKQISKLSFLLSVQVHYFLGQSEEERKTFFGGCKKGDALCDYPQEYLIVIKDEKVCPLMKFGIILTLLYCLLDPLTNKHRRAWSSMINLQIDSRTCQKYRIMLSLRQRSNNYLEFSKENILGSIMLSH